MSDTRKISEIHIRDRTRGDLGDLLPLEASIDGVGLLNAVVINTRNELVAGGRRLQACTNLGWEEVPVRVVEKLDDAVLALQAELEENTAREPLAPADLVRHAARLKELHKPEAAKRKAKGRPKKGETPPDSGGVSPGEVQRIVARALNTSHDTLTKAEKADSLIKANPERNADLAAQFAKPGAKVDPIYREAKRREVESKPKPEVKTNVGIGRSGEPRSDTGGAKPNPERATGSAPRVGGVAEVDRVEERQRTVPQAVEPPAPQRDAEATGTDPTVSDREQKRRQSIEEALRLILSAAKWLGDAQGYRRTDDLEQAALKLGEALALVKV